jgi:crotonyl-CoA carboxylase/reductase
MAVQITRAHGGIPIAVVSSRSRAEHCMALGAFGVIDRTQFDHWGRQPDLDDRESSAAWLEGVKRFGRAIWTALGRRQNPKIIFEHSGAATLPTSLYVCDNAGMVVICAGTSGYLTDIDLRYLWMRQKRIQGSHFANIEQCRAVNALIMDKAIDPCLSRTWSLRGIGEAHQMMCDNHHPPGNMAVLVGAPAAGLTRWPW